MRNTVVFFRIKCGVDAKEFKKLCSVKIMLERLEKESWFDDTETDEIEEKRAVLGLEDEDSERSSTFCGESIFSGSSQSTSITVYSSDVSFIDDREELCEEFVYANPYCSQNSTPNERKIIESSVLHSCYGGGFGNVFQFPDSAICI